ncbi:MAG: hypothetical protein QN716_01620 [Nitrososphaeraceae archaeon]|nr:hypothetical protein [Nitrososphaeraceae archaeon]
MTWRKAICLRAGLGDLLEYEGYGGEKSLASIKDTGLFILLNHSDCDGEMLPAECKLVADSLTKLLPRLSGDYGGHIGDIKDKTIHFIDGCLLAYRKRQKLIIQIERGITPFYLNN